MLIIETSPYFEADFYVNELRNVEKMEKMGRSISTAKADYEDLVTTRRRQLEKPLDKIEDITNLVDSNKSENLDEQQKL